MRCISSHWNCLKYLKRTSECRKAKVTERDPVTQKCSVLNCFSCFKRFTLSRKIMFKGRILSRMKCYLLTLMLFQTCLTFSFQWNRNPMKAQANIYSLFICYLFIFQVFSNKKAPWTLIKTFFCLYKYL